jgi:hypothetical protein
MSWKYNRYRNYGRSYVRTYRPKFFFSEKEIDFTAESLDYTQFLLQEFFNADRETKKNLAKYYVEKFGMRSYSYLDRKYLEWANGDYHLTDMMRERILSFMPLFLSKEAKHNLGLHEFMSSIKWIVRRFESEQNLNYRSFRSISNSDDLLDILEREHDKIKNLTSYKYKFNILTEEEKLEAIEIGKYILEVKLQNTFNQIKRDLDIFLPYLTRITKGIFEVNYKIPIFKISMDVLKIKYLQIPIIEISDTEATSRFKYYSDKYLASEMVSIHKQSQTAVKNSFLTATDLNIFEDHYLQIIKSDSEVNMKSTFESEAGILEFNFKFLPKKILLNLFLQSLAKLTIYIIVIVTLLGLPFFTDFESIFVIFGFIFGIALISLAKMEFDNLHSKIEELKKYGKQ